MTEVNNMDSQGVWVKLGRGFGLGGVAALRKAALRRAATAAVVSLLSAAPAVLVGCGSQVEPFDPHQFVRGERDNAADREVPKRPAPPEQLEEPARADANRPVIQRPGAIVRLPLQEVIHRTVANSSEVRVAGYEPAVDESRIIEAQARFDPEFFIRGSYDTQYNVSPSSTGNVVSDPFNPTVFRILQGSTGFRKILENGGEAEISYRAQRIQRDFGTPDATEDPSENDPYYTNDIVLRITQPLLRDFGADINEARITIARQNARVSLLEFRRILEETLTETERTYWQLVQAQHEVRIQQDLLGRTVETHNILFERFQQGVDVSRIQLSLARQSVQSRRAVLVRARARVFDLSDQLKRLMNDPEFPVAGGTVVLPATGALVEPLDLDLQEAIETGLQNRLELGQQRARIESARITQRVAENNLLPQLNFLGNMTFQGVGTDYTGYNGATSNLSDFEFINSSAGLEYVMPLGNRAARAIFKRTRLQRMQAVEQYRNLVAQISLDVSVALREISTTWNEFVDRKRARIAAADALDAIGERRRAGEALRPEFVQLELDTQERLAVAAAEEQAAIANYNIALARFERAKGTLLRYDNVVLDDAQLDQLRPR